MARIELAPGYEGLRGKIGNIVIRRFRSGKYFMSPAPDMSKVKPSPAQLANRQKFKEAAAYARAALADPQAGAYYRERAAQENKLPFKLAMSDGCKGIDRLKVR